MAEDDLSALARATTGDVLAAFAEMRDDVRQPLDVRRQAEWLVEVYTAHIDACCALTGRGGN